MFLETIGMTLQWWGIVESMNEMLSESIWNAIGVVTFLFVDYMKSFVCCSWLEMDFIVNLCGKGWCATYNKKMIFIWWSVPWSHMGGLSANKLGVKLISIVCDGNNVFRGAKVNVITWWRIMWLHFLLECNVLHIKLTYLGWFYQI